MESNVLIHGIGLGGYRSFGTDLQQIGPLGKINLLVGQNNSGKSNVLRFVHDHYGKTLSRVGRGRGELGFASLDAHLPQPCPIRFAVAVKWPEAFHESLTGNLQRRGAASSAVKEILNYLSDEADLSWFCFGAPSIGVDKWEVDGAWLQGIAEKYPTPDHWRMVSEALTNRSTRVLLLNAASVLENLIQRAARPPQVALVPAIRQIGAGEIAEGDYSGADIINRLADLQHPAYEELEKKERFQAITEFVRSVLDDPAAQIEVPVRQDTIHVQLGQSVLPLEHLGTGIHEVTMLAAWATIFNNHVLCVEEPELHLHPLLQKKLLRYLDERTSNQYLITTHSAQVLDHPGAAIFHVRWDGSQTIVRRAETSADRVRICSDLGYRPADLLQTNAVVWVEGPSDRLYIRHWIEATDPSLIEGIHYSIMFYGGRLLSHLSADDEEVEDFISLRRINQHLAIVIDSDKSKRHTPINATKRRVRDEFDKGPGFAWVTQGREIENYLLPGVVWEAVQQAHPSATKLGATGRYDKVLSYRATGSTTSQTADKVKVARVVCARDADLSVLDLRRQVRRLVTFIRDANGLRPPTWTSS